MRQFTSIVFDVVVVVDFAGGDGGLVVEGGVLGGGGGEGGFEMGFGLFGGDGGEKWFWRGRGIVVLEEAT